MIEKYINTLSPLQAGRVKKALKNYHKDYDEVNKVYRNNPKHDWSSHCADMIRYWAVTNQNNVIIQRPTYNTQIKSYG
jgi:hypothetical protein